MLWKAGESDDRRLRRFAVLGHVRRPDFGGFRIERPSLAISTEFSPGGRKNRGNVDNLLCAKCALFAPEGLAWTWPAG
jgi:hypothetical protein